MSERLSIQWLALLFTASLLALYLLGNRPTKAFHTNLTQAMLARTWFSVSYQGLRSDSLQDGIPDEWDIYWWGGSKQTYEIDAQSPFAGNQSARIEHTNDQGGVALTQTFDVEPGSSLLITAYTRGTDGVVHVWFRSETGDTWVQRGLDGWAGIESSKDWQQFSMTVTIPSNMREAKLLLKSTDSMSFDEIYAGVKKNGGLGANLLRNPGFERDGVSENPLEWWQRSVVIPEIPEVLKDDTQGSLSYLNITDMLAKRYDNIKQRARQIGEGCAARPEMTSWLLARSDDFEKAGGVATRERLYQLAIELTPNCPQPYAALGKLYESHQAFQRAAKFYHQAAGLAGETAQSGGYSFQEGFLHVRYTGDTGQAIPALRRAERLSGWEGGNPWYWGAASFYLGQALEAKGHYTEAAQAYQRVLNCEQCSHRAASRERLQALSEQ